MVSGDPLMSSESLVFEAHSVCDKVARANQYKRPGVCDV